jgi:hypothetical protein
MIHRTFRSLDQPPKLLGFTIGQWAALVLGAVVTGGFAYMLQLPAKAAITLLVLLLGVPATLLYVSESGGPAVGRLLADLLRWCVTLRRLGADGASAGRRERRLAEALPNVARVDPDGLLVRADGCPVRYLSVSSVNPLVMEPAEAERCSAGFAEVAARLEDGESLQLYTTATPLNIAELLADETDGCELVAQIAELGGERPLAQCIRGLGELSAQSLRLTCERERPLSFSYVVACPWAPRRARWSRGGVADEEREAGQLARRSDGIRADLEAAGLTVAPLDGAAVLDLIGDRLDPARGERLVPPVSLTANDLLGEGSNPGDLAGALRSAPMEFRARELTVGERAEQCMFVSLAPEQTWLGWLLHLMGNETPFTVTVHVTATERHRERTLQRRRYRRVHGVNRGVEARGQLLDPDARLHEQDALELNDELARGSGAGIYQLGIYAAFTEPAGDPAALEERCATAARELSLACDAGVQQGPFAQLPLWRSTLPLGEDPARRRRKYVAANVGDSFPLLGSTVSSPDGIPLGVAFPGRSLVRLDPFDVAHPNHLLLINGMSGAGKTMSAIVMLARAISRGARGCIIDRAGHFEFLASLIPGAGTVALGAEHTDAINCWDVPDPAAVGPEKIDYLLALHALLLGEHDQGRDSYGLTDLEANLLGVAIGEVYKRCARSGEAPRELLLQQQLEQRYSEERAEGSVGIAEALRNLSMRLSNYVADGPYAYLTDRQTTVAPGAPLLVFDTRSIPDAKAPAALFVICEHVKRRIETVRAEHLASDTAGAGEHGWAGRSFLVVDEAWKLIERPATGRWFNEFCRRSRHYALCLVAISQQLSDFENEHGRALLANATMRLFLRQEARELAYVQQALGLSAPALAAIGELNTVKGSHADAYLMNGTRGQGTLRITVGPGEYWLSTSDPVRDEPVRRRALRETGGNPWQALQLLAADGAPGSKERP